MDPAIQDLLQTVLLRTMLTTMMFAMGLRLTLTSLASVYKRVGTITWLLALNFVLIPILAVACIGWLDVGTQAAAGIVVCACAPGGAVASLLSRNVGGDIPTAVATLLILVFTSLLVTPFAVDIGLNQLGRDVGTFNSFSALQTILIYQCLPLVMGMVIHHFHPTTALKLEPWFARTATGLLLLVVIGFTVAKSHLVFEAGWRSVVVVLIVVVCSYVLGGLSPGNQREKVSTAYTSGAKNLALGTLLVEQYLSDIAFFSVMIFGLFTYLLLLLVAPAAKRSIAAPS